MTLKQGMHGPLDRAVGGSGRVHDRPVREPRNRSMRQLGRGPNLIAKQRLAPTDGSIPARSAPDAGGRSP